MHETPDGPTPWWMWGEIQRALGRLEQGQSALAQRQDDMHRWTLHHLTRIEQRLETKSSDTRSTLLRWALDLPWGRLVLWIASISGSGWGVMQWLRVLFGQ
jgi:hypothetical protein